MKTFIKNKLKTEVKKRAIYSNRRKKKNSQFLSCSFKFTPFYKHSNFSSSAKNNENLSKISKKMIKNEKKNKRGIL